MPSTDVRRLVFAALGALVPAIQAQAADCARTTDQLALNTCADESLRKADAELNRLYRQITGRLQGEADTARALVAAQRAWLAFRDAECTFVTSDAAGGSIYPMIYSGCLEGLTRKRIADLKVFLSCQEGDMSCPVPAQ